MEKNNFDIVIIGGGLSGLLASIILGKHANISVGLFEQGPDYLKRRILVEHDKSYHLKGMGGAGTLEGGKLCSIPASTQIWEKTTNDLQYWDDFIYHLPLNENIQRILIDSKRTYFVKSLNNGPLMLKNYESILLLKYEMSTFINNLINEAQNNGVEIFKESRIEDIIRKEDKFHLRMKGEGNYSITSNYVVVATGRTSANHLRNLLEKLPVKITEQNPDLGIRLEFPRNHAYLFSQIGKDIKIKVDSNGHTLRTFCVCSGGIVSPIQIDSFMYVDGHFGNILTNNVGVGIMSRSASIKGYSSAMEYCNGLSHSKDKNINLDDFLKYGSKIIGKDYRSKFSDTIDSLNMFIKKLLLEGMLDVNPVDCKVNLPAVDRYNPLIETDSNFETDCKNLFVIGDAAGISRGYIQSLWSGWCSGNYITNKINNTEKYNSLEAELVKYA